MEQLKFGRKRFERGWMPRRFIRKKWELLINIVNYERGLEWAGRKAMEAQIADIRAEFKTEEAEVKKSIKQEKLRQRKMLQDREMRSKASAISRNGVKKGDPGGGKDKKP